MSDFTSNFWSVFITSLTLLGIIGCLVLLWVSGKTKAMTTADNTTGHVWDGDLREMNNPLPRWWMYLFWITIFFAVAYLAIYPGFGNSNQSRGQWAQYDAEMKAGQERFGPVFAKYREMDVMAVAAASAVLLTGCSSGGPFSPASDSAGAPAFEEHSVGAADRAESAEGAPSIPGNSSGSENLAAAEQYLVREATIGLKVDTIAEAAGKVRAIAAGAGGTVTEERFGDEVYGPARESIERYGTMTISVPSDKLDATIEELTKVGDVRTRSSSAYSVQDEYVDVEARIATLTASIERMRALMSRTEDIKQIVELETALSARQADLDSLQARLNSLKASIAMSPVTVILTTTSDLGQPDDGFIAALKNAWTGFTRSAAVLVTTIGVLLPWILVGGLGVALLIWALRARSRRRSSAATPSATAAAPTTATPAPTEPEQREPTPGD